MNEVATAVYRLEDRDRLGWGAVPGAAGERQAREEREFYIPDLLSGTERRARPGLHAAAERHAGRLHKAAQHLDDALNLAQVLRASMCDAADSRAMQVETVLKIVEKKLGKAHAQIDRHETDHMNLFLAYFAGGDTPDE